MIKKRNIFLVVILLIAILGSWYLIKDNKNKAIKDFQERVGIESIGDINCILKECNLKDVKLKSGEIIDKVYISNVNSFNELLNSRDDNKDLIVKLEGIKLQLEEMNSVETDFYYIKDVEIKRVNANDSKVINTKLSFPSININSDIHYLKIDDILSLDTLKINIDIKSSELLFSLYKANLESRGDINRDEFVESIENEFKFLENQIKLFFNSEYQHQSLKDDVKFELSVENVNKLSNEEIVDLINNQPALLLQKMRFFIK